MSERPPYLDEQWDDLPLPDGEAAWRKMSLLLDDDKRKRRVIPWWFWRLGAAVLILTAMAVGTWMWLKEDKKQTAVVERIERQGLPVTNENVVAPGKEAIHQPQKDQAPSIPVAETSQGQSRPNTALNLPTAERKETEAKRETLTKNSAGKLKSKKSETLETPSPLSPLAKKNSGNISVGETGSPSTESIAANENGKDSLITLKEVVKDTVAAKDTAKAFTDSSNLQNGRKKPQAIAWSAGIGLQRSIALSGQTSSPYNYAGRQSGLSDNIPSVYLRAQKGKWFLQGEFHYAVPQPVEAVAFSQRTSYDAATLSLNTERLVMQKLYYHQLPLSLNYSLLSNFFIGVGGTYNLLAGAVTQQEVTSKNVQTNSETISRNVAPVKGFRDSFLYKTTTGLLVQADYHWRRIAFGLRYTQSLQPFIKYTRPDGTVLDQRSGVLQAILRFRLWEKK